MSETLDILGREGPQGDGSEHADTYTLLTGLLDGFLTDACHATESHDEIFGILGKKLFGTGLVLLDKAVFSLKMQVVLLHCLGYKFECGHDVGSATFGTAGDSPRAFARYLLVGATGTESGQFDALHHLTDDTVGKHHDRIAVFVCEVKTETYEVSHLLNRCRSEHYQMIVAVTSALGGLEIVAL